MLDLVSATGYIKKISEEHGYSRPLVLSVARPHGELCEAHVKITDGSRITIQSLVIEAIASLLAVDLGIFTPEPFLVDISPEFIDSTHDMEIIQRLNRACRVGFGSKSIPNGYSIVQNCMKLDSSNKQAAAEILAFDALIDNPDRGGAPPAKNNCLIYQDSFYIIDHEKAFHSAMGFIIGAKEPWVLGGCDYLTSPNSHLFINELRNLRKKIDFTSFKNKWKNLSNTRLQAYIDALPNEWSSEKTNAQKIIQKLVNLRDNIEGCVNELQRVLG